MYARQVIVVMQAVLNKGIVHCYMTTTLLMRVQCFYSACTGCTTRCGKYKVTFNVQKLLKASKELFGGTAYFNWGIGTHALILKWESMQ